jgi:hypothetical protein
MQVVDSISYGCSHAAPSDSGTEATYYGIHTRSPHISTSVLPPSSTTTPNPLPA